MYFHFLRPSTLLLCSLAAAQSAPAPPTATAAQDAVRALPGGALVYDEPGDGSLWAAGRTYKACCDGASFTYVPFLGSDAPRSLPLRFTLTQARAADTAVALARGTPRRTGNRVTVARGALTEIYDFTEDSVEQSFAFADLPARGDLVLTLKVEGDLRGEPAPEGIVFRSERGAVHYTHAVALDAAGARLPLAIDAVDGSVRLTVPAAFVADCHLPLVVDPLIRTETLQPTAFHEDAPSLAWCGQAQTWFAVWQRHYSATDLDVFAQRLDHTMTPVGTRTSIDMTLDSWERPKVASTHTPPRFLTVAQVVPAGNAGPSWIGGRLFRTDTGSFDPVLVIDREGVAGHHPGNKTTPDVGGDTNGLSPSHFTVVFCREAGPDNRDVLLRQVTADGALRTASALVLDDTRADEHSPAISHGNGWWVNDRQRWAVVWIRRAVHHGVPDGDVRAAIITTDGQPDPLAGGAPFTLDETAADDDAPSVSSLMEGDRVKFLFLCTVTRKVGGGDRDVFGILFDGHGAVRSTQNLSQIDGSPAGIVQGDASVDTDGARFVVTYTEHVGHTRSFLSLLAWQPHDDQLLLQQGRVQLASGYQRDARVCARSSSGAGHPHYGVAYTVLPGSGNRHVALALFDGVLPGGFSIRPTGCAGLEVTPASTPAIGHSIAFNLNRGGVVGMLLGLPAHVPLPCASCALGVADPLLLPGTTLPIPPFPNLVGAVVAVQCFHVGTGTCFGNLALSNTVDVTIQ